MCIGGSDVRFGLFYEWPNPHLRDWKRLFEEGMEQIQYSEEMGFDFVLIAEHHFTNYGNSPAPLLQALYIAERTKRLKVGTAVLVLPIWQPLRLAEEVAVLDNLTGGRVICGVGRGYQPYEFARFGVTPEESRGRFNETLEVLVKAWTCDCAFTYDGQYVQIPHELVVWPKPYQKPHPPFWIAGTSADTMLTAAEWDMLPITTGFGGVQGLRTSLGVLVRRRHELGKPCATDFGVQALTLVAESEEEATSYLRYARWQLRANRALNRSDVRDGKVQVTPYEGEHDDATLRELIFYGTPDTVIKKFRRAAEAGVTTVSCWMMLGGIEHEKVMKSIRLMGEEVIPALKHVCPPESLYQELLATGVDAASLGSTGPVPS
jgi:alkanesulfonate monooxygenase SsuD/methylene tetrahydromethanopterin reductase-like flavin-dependent oxidoreductase (luciferase family)